MSVKLTARVWALEDEDLKDARLLVLLALADYASDAGLAWPSIATLAKRTRVCERQVQRAAQWLVDHGYTKIVEKGNGRGNVTTYMVTIKGDIVTPFSEEKGDIAPPIDGIKGDISSIKGDIGEANQSHARRDPPIEPPKEKEGVPARVTHNFFDPRKFVNGKVPPGTGKTPMEVFHEVHSAKDNRNMLEAISLEAVSKAVSDLELWREVVVAWALHGNKPANIEGQLDWYKDPSRFRKNNNGNHSGSNSADYQRPAQSKHTAAEHATVNSQRRAEGLPF